MEVTQESEILHSNLNFEKQVEGHSFWVYFMWKRYYYTFDQSRKFKNLVSTCSASKLFSSHLLFLFVLFCFKDTLKACGHFKKLRAH